MESSILGSERSADSNSKTEAYLTKPVGYFSGARASFIDILPASESARLLEVGCGNGDTAAYAKACGRCALAVGVELCAEPAAEAATKLDRVLVGDIEQMSLDFPREHFDILVLSEVLEHLRDPWLVLQRLHPFLKPGATVLAGSPNVAHWSVIAMLLKGRWDHNQTGIMDRTHLRWFTADSYRQMFEDSGYAVDFSGPANPLRFKARCLSRLSCGYLRKHFHSQIFLRAIRE